MLQAGDENANLVNKAVQQQDTKCKVRQMYFCILGFFLVLWTNTGCFRKWVTREKIWSRQRRSRQTRARCVL